MRFKSIALIPSVVGVLSALSIGVVGCSQPQNTDKPLDHNVMLSTEESVDGSVAEDAEEVFAEGVGAETRQVHQMNRKRLMSLGPSDDEFDLRFIDAVVLHHEGAIAMAKQVIQLSQRNDLKQLAQTIITTQQSEIDQAKQWRQSWYPDADTVPMMYDSVSGETSAMSTEMQDAMRTEGTIDITSADLDQQFLKVMIPHHKMALKMAKQVREKSDRPELNEFAHSMLKAQRQNVKQMKQWLQALTE